MDNTQQENTNSDSNIEQNQQLIESNSVDSNKNEEYYRLCIINKYGDDVNKKDNVTYSKQTIRSNITYQQLITYITQYFMDGLFILKEDNDIESIDINKIFARKYCIDDVSKVMKMMNFYVDRRHYCLSLFKEILQHDFVQNNELSKDIPLELVEFEFDRNKHYDWETISIIISKMSNN